MGFGRWRNWNIHKTPLSLQWGKSILGSETHNEQWEMSKKIHSSEQTTHKMPILSQSLWMGNRGVSKTDILFPLKYHTLYCRLKNNKTINQISVMFEDKPGEDMENNRIREICLRKCALGKLLWWFIWAKKEKNRRSDPYKCLGKKHAGNPGQCMKRTVLGKEMGYLWHWKETAVTEHLLCKRYYTTSYVWVWECVPLQVVGCGWADSIQHRVRPWPPDFGHFTSHDSFTQLQVLRAGFCHAIQSKQVIRPVPVLRALAEILLYPLPVFKSYSLTFRLSSILGKQLGQFKVTQQL